jgi:hypothetical protein
VSNNFSLLYQYSFHKCNPIYNETSIHHISNINLQFEGGRSHLPLVDPNMRARPLTPSEWKERLEASKCLDVSSSKTSGQTFGRELLLLDVRNG